MMEKANNILLWIVAACTILNVTIMLDSQQDNYKPSDVLQVEEVCVDDYKILVFVRNGKIVGVIHDPQEYMDDPIEEQLSSDSGAIVY